MGWTPHRGLFVNLAHAPYCLFSAAPHAQIALLKLVSPFTMTASTLSTHRAQFVPH